ncbi:MAG: tryptophan 2,3-dioxygenase [Ignavibacteriae bacterium]|nr:tryptophan 2,3-dioxygenase [Ignavibacteriota bacterium]
MDKPYPPVYYAEYLKLEQLLGAQSPKSAEYGAPAHDEMLFIIVHQAYELWFKQILHEMGSVIDLFAGDTVDEKVLGTAVSRLHRIVEIQKVIIDQLRVLETMTPMDFLDFRDYLFPASGFQSVQFRLVEIAFGLKAEQRLLYNQFAYHTRVSPEHQELLKRAESQPSLYDLLERWLERTPFLDAGDYSFWQEYRGAVHAMLDGDRAVIAGNTTLTELEKRVQFEELDATAARFNALFEEPLHEELRQSGKRRLSHRATQAALFIVLYRDQPILQLPYRLLAGLIDVDEMFTTWRYRHALMVHRMIGTKIGTGGSSGYHYLKSTAENHRVYTDLIDLSTYIIPRAALPALSADMERRLGFAAGY